MLSGECNENGEKTKIGSISKKATFHVEQGCSTLFFVNFFAAVLHDYNVKLQETFWLHTFSGGNVLRSFSTWCLLAFLIFSPPLQIFHVVLPAKNVFFVFLSLALALCRSFSRWALLACRLLSRFLCLFLSLYSKSVNMTINLCLTLFRQHGYRNNFRFPFLSLLTL